MKIAVSFVGYEISEWFHQVIEPWKQVKNGAIPGVELVTATSLGVFPETHALGFPIHSRDNSESLVQNESFFDDVKIHNTPMYEKDQRNSTLDYLLKQDISILLLCDFDEIWTVEQIKNMLDFVQKNKFIDWFRVEYKNYILFEGKKAFYYGFNPPRIWRNTIRGGIDKYWYDNDICFRDGNKQESVSNLTIPRKLVCPEHYSWYSKDVDYLTRKVRFQTNHYKISSFKEHLLGVTWNKEYYQHYGKTIPELIYE